jgi:hypothetical protein
MFRAMLVLAAAGALALPAVASAKPATFTAQAYQTSSSHSGSTQHFAETLKVGGKVEGHDKITCKLVAPAKAQDTLAIIGGTGSYNGAKGVLHLNFLSATHAVETYAFS